ncbi:hypothetical protein SeMB42_g05728 [Synchytrium endobioticum]|uniref:Ima1 N-terminal domain-containing protein n=1 Tax=Synchytrium endobioticum TaxID=286115 RepID=A0A507CPP5_9FUNG|nr:hypothetical protein SeMB42_g05728 [Synchytrium endobioticum]TPX47143.1 hypothetical protein SeLEV6574_g02818 [Synchytrium endobioticum]
MIAPQEIAVYTAVSLFVAYITRSPLQKLWSQIQLWRKAQGTASCFYCNEESFVPAQALLPGGRWWCVLCENLNTYDEKGNPQLLDEGLPDDPVVNSSVAYSSSNDIFVHHLERTTDHSVLKRASSEQRTQPKKSQQRVFCSKCIQNQNILIQLLSAYDPDDDDYFELNVDAYKAKIEAQYPPVCSECDPLVRTRLAELSRNIKATIHLASQRFIAGFSVPSHFATSQKSAVGRFSMFYAAIWVVMIVGPILIHLLTALAYLRGFIYPASFHPGYVPLHCRPDKAYGGRFYALWNLLTTLPLTSCDECCARGTFQSLATLSLFSFLGIPFNPLWIIKARNPKAQTINQMVYTWSHVKLILLRLYSIYVLQYSWSVKMHAALEAAFLVLTCVGVVSTYCMVQVRVKQGPKLQFDAGLKSRNSLSSKGMMRSHSGNVSGNMKGMNMDEPNNVDLGLETALATSDVTDTDQGMLAFLNERNALMSWKKRTWSVYALAVGIRCVSMTGFDAVYFASTVALCISLDACRKSVSTFPSVAKGTSPKRMFTAMCLLIVRIALVLPTRLIPSIYPPSSSTHLSTTLSLYPFIPSMKGTEVLGAFDISSLTWVNYSGITLDLVWITSAVFLGLGVDGVLDIAD